MIEIKNLVKTYQQCTILNNMTMDFKDGEFVSIVGPSGCGKTTLLNILGLLDFNYKGSLIIQGQAVNSLSNKKRATFIHDNISYLFQNYALIDDKSVQYNLELCFFKKGERKKNLAIMQNALDKVGLKNKLSAKVFELSGGEQQRVSLARLLILNRPIILCDEPTGNLDPHNRDLVLHILQELNDKGATIIIVTHDELVANMSHRIISLEKLQE